MKAVFHGKKITGILSVIPETVVKFDDEVNNLSLIHI